MSMHDRLHLRPRLLAAGSAALCVVLLAGCGTAPLKPGDVPPAATASATPIQRVDATPAPTAVPVPTMYPTTRPADYERSCAATANGAAWGQPAARPFVCVEPDLQLVPSATGRQLTVRGFAAGAQGDQLLIQWQIRSTDGKGLVPANAPRIPWGYSAPAPGQPGGWVMTIDRPDAIPSATLMLTATLEGGEGRVVAEAKAELPIR